MRADRAEERVFEEPIDPMSLTLGKAERDARRELVRRVLLFRRLSEVEPADLGTSLADRSASFVAMVRLPSGLENQASSRTGEVLLPARHIVACA